MGHEAAVSLTSFYLFMRRASGARRLGSRGMASLIEKPHPPAITPIGSSRNPQSKELTLGSYPRSQGGGCGGRRHVPPRRPRRSPRLPRSEVGWDAERGPGSGRALVWHTRGVVRVPGPFGPARPVLDVGELGISIGELSCNRIVDFVECAGRAGDDWMGFVYRFRTNCTA